MSSKPQIRQQILEARRSFPSEKQFEFSQIIIQKFLSLPFVQSSLHLGLYASLPGEVLTLPLINELLTQNKKIYLPRIPNSNLLEFVQVENVSHLQIKKYGILEPHEEHKSFPPRQLELVVVPGVAFDLQGNRLGWGKGYYDRFLANFRGLKIAFAYDFQIMDGLPVAAHDVTMDIILTESQEISIRPNIQ